MRVLVIRPKSADVIPELGLLNWFVLVRLKLSARNSKEYFYMME